MKKEQRRKFLKNSAKVVGTLGALEFGANALFAVDSKSVTNFPFESRNTRICYCKNSINTRA